MRSMLVAPSGERQLVELKAVDAAWPLVGGQVAMSWRPPPPNPLPQGEGAYGETILPLPLAGGGWGRGPPQIPAILSNHGLLAERVSWTV